MKKKYQSKILQAIHEDMKEFHEEGLISDERMREFDEGCLVKKPVKNRKISDSIGQNPTVRISAKSAVL
ncbi:MAG: hypothetical protein FWD24_06900 [Treponema sp.]|nr:hypothetical protein [Treponema sp.]